MSSLSEMRDLLSSVHSVVSVEDLEAALGETCERIGCSYFALIEHTDFLNPIGPVFRVHNYPAAWEHWFDQQRLGVSDPIHRASHRTSFGFKWGQVPDLIPLSKRDRLVLSEARIHGIGGGFTVPAHVPGETLGSCSFACARDEDLGDDVVPFAQFAGQILFERARRLFARRPPRAMQPLTDRQIECIIWVGRGKTDWEISKILGVSKATVVEHLRNARERYDATTRAMLTVRALCEGAVCLKDLASDTPISWNGG